MIYFESNFKSYQKSIESTISRVSDYWQIVFKNQLDIAKSEVMARKIFESYREFNQIYKYLTSECGDIIIIESLAWRFHSEVLNFEYEANINLEKVKQIMTKQRLHS